MAPGGEDRLRAARPGLGAAGERAQARGDLLVRERLHDVVVGAGVQPEHPVVDRVARGEHQDADVDAVLAQAAGDVEAGHVRQADVEDDGVEAVERRRELDPGPAVGRVLDDVAILLEEAGQAAGEAFVVLDEKQVHRPKIVRRQAPTPDVALAMSAAASLIGIAKPRPCAPPRRRRC